MDVLILGGTRFVGALTAWRFLARGARVTLLNRGTIADPFGDRVERLRVDRTTPALATALAGRRFDAVVDFCAYTAADVAPVLDSLGPRVGHYLFISTGQVYLVRADCPRPAKESDYAGPLMPKPTNAHDLEEWEYGIYKREAEDAILAFAGRGVPSSRLRIPMVNGERDYHRRIEGYLRRLVDGGPLIVPDGGGHETRHVYGDDVARTIVAIAGRRETFGQAYNLAQRETPTLWALLERLRDLVGSTAELLAVPRAELEAAGLSVTDLSPFSGTWMSFLDPSRATRELGFDPTPFDQVLGRIVASFLAFAPTPPPPGYARRADELALLSR
jgi:nucleoside-diphosphate-sugar epimerase